MSRTEEVPLGGAETTEQFAATMPPRYRVLFDARAVRWHSAITQRREGRPAHVEVWRALPDGTTELCVVADDRPGLLSMIAAALAARHLEVVMALLFTRARPGAPDEAVDFFWVRRADGRGVALDVDEEAEVQSLVAAMIAGRRDAVEVAPARPPGPRDVVVRFEPGADGDGDAVLTVETRDAPALLFAIATALHAGGIHILQALVRTVRGRVHNRFEVEAEDGCPLDDARRARVRAAVVAAIEG